MTTLLNIKGKYITIKPVDTGSDNVVYEVVKDMVYDNKLKWYQVDIDDERRLTIIEMSEEQYRKLIKTLVGLKNCYTVDKKPICILINGKML